MWGHAGENMPEDGIDRTGWFNYYQKYSPPRIPYIPGTATETVYAQCNLSATSENVEAGTILLAQNAFQPMYLKYDLTGLDTEAQYNIRINVAGTLGEDCANVVAEYNPLEEVDSWGRPNPTQDPQRGRITPVTSNGDGELDLADLNAVLANLSGPRSIIGRSLSVYTGEGEVPRACCTIGRIRDPTLPKEP